MTKEKGTVMSSDIDLERAYETVRNHPEHRRGLADLRLEITAPPTRNGPYSRVRGRLVGEIDARGWARANTAFRIEVPAATGGNSVSRIYTVARFDADAGEIEFDVLHHAHPSPMMRWLESLTAGDSFEVVGPRGHLLPGFDGRPVALFADESAVPALITILLDWAPGATGLAVIASDDADVRAMIPEVPGVTTRFVAGTPGALLAEAPGIPADHTVWAAGERTEMRALRDHFRGRGLARHDVRPFGYWQLDVDATHLDMRRLEHFAPRIEAGESVTDVDDLDIPA